MAGRGRGRGGGGGGGRGRGRGGAGPASISSGRGGSPAISATSSVAGAPSVGLPSAHIETVGVRRKGPGTSGQAIKVFTNHFACDIPDGIIYHYDAMTPSEQTMPVKANMDVIRQLQEVTAPQVFTPRAAYDGRKNLFTTKELPFQEGTASFDVFLGPAPSQGEPVRERRPHKVKLTKVATINPEVLRRFLEGKQSHDNTVLTAITALNVVVRMEPTSRYPFNVRSFFTNHETKYIGNGIELWRGYFQSVRPSPGRMLINIDISTGTMYKPGPLIDLCLEFLGRPGNPNILAPSKGLPERERQRLQKFLAGVRVNTTQGNGQPGRSPRVLKKLSNKGANQMTFQLREGGTLTVAAYFQQHYNRALRFPDLLCAEVGNGALIPLELCTVPPGQIMRKQVPPEKTKDVLEFATKKPQDRLASIRNGLGVLSYGQSEYVRQFGMHVKDAEGPLAVNARILQAPTLQYGTGSKQVNITPRDGAWNMIDRKFYRPSSIDRWVVVVYERPQRFNDRTAQEMVKGFMDACAAVGIAVREREPLIRYENPQGRTLDQLRDAGRASQQKNGGKLPQLIVIILPEGATDLYTAIKHFGDVHAGVATQCMKSSKCFRAKPQYYANVCLKVNVKLGGINTIPDPRSVAILTDPRNPTMVMGADVIHPAAHTEGRPSFTSLVASVDSDTAKYVADCRVQTSRQEMIEDLEEMTFKMLDMYQGYRGNVEKKKADDTPKRIIFFRDGVSEGQFRQVLEIELPRIKKACQRKKINPQITVIVVGKRHHVRFFPMNPQEADRSGNCRAGTVVDRDIVHPVELDFYLQSHGGLLGTSRPAHYNVLYDDVGFSADSLQALCFALCHVYARSTRSVSIPAPVYYADIVCSRAKNHYDPSMSLDPDESHTGTSAEAALDRFKANFKQLHPNMKFFMYFS